MAISGTRRPDLDDLPPWTGDPLARLEHTLAYHRAARPIPEPTAMALYATLTSNPAPGVPPQTGVTWADLQALRDELRGYRAGGTAPDIPGGR